MPSAIHVRTGVEPLDVAAAVAFVTVAEAGGTVVFSGSVRSPNDGVEVDHLTYETWEGRVDASLTAIAEDAIARFAAARVWIEHRTGRVDVAEPSVVVAVSCGHRAEAFEAGRWIIDTLKARAPIWKREVTADGEVWVGMPEDAR